LTEEERRCRYESQLSISENLFGRYGILDKPTNGQIKNFETLLQIPEVVTLDPGRSGRIKPKAISEKQRVATANAILGAKPDILAVQEVENLATLRIFNSKYTGGSIYLSAIGLSLLRYADYTSMWIRRSLEQ